MSDLAQQYLRALQKMLPEDCKRYPEDGFARVAEHAAMLRETVPWAKKYSKEIFQQYVLCPRVNDEDLFLHPEVFFDALYPSLEQDPVEDVARVVNEWCACHARYAPTDDRTASPRTVFTSGFGRCGELSTFVVYVLRSLGIAARQVYVPKWSHTDDNHAWVEFLAGRTWYYFGACEPRPYLNSGWFSGIASQAALVRSKAFGKAASALHGPFLYQEGNVSYFNQIARYCPVTRPRTITVLRGNRPVSQAKIRLQVLNEGAFHTIAVLTADDLGRAFFQTGGGTVRLSVFQDGLEAVQDSSILGEEVVLELKPPVYRENGWTPRTPFRPAPLLAEPEYFNEDSLLWMAEMREAITKHLSQREAQLRDSSQDGNVPASCRDLLDAARGNRRELIAFLQGDHPDRRERLLRTLPEKDLRDTPCTVLESHFRNLPEQGNLPDHIYWNYLASPKLHMEKLICWRSGHNDLLFLPLAEQRVSICRNIDIPARIRPLDGRVERYENGAFRLNPPEPTGALVLTAEVPIPDNLWSISHVESDGSLQILNPVEYPWIDGGRYLPLVAGRYRLVSCVRAPDGRQFYQERDLNVEAGGVYRIPLPAVPLDPGDLILQVEMPPISGKRERDRKSVSLFRSGQPTLLLWFQTMDEPAVHLLQELKQQGPLLAEVFPRIYVILEKKSPEYGSLKQELSSILPQAEFIQTTMDFYADEIARLMNLTPGTYPMVVVGNGQGDAFYGHAGYAVGVLDSMLHTLLDCVDTASRILRDLFYPGDDPVQAKDTARSYLSAMDWFRADRVRQRLSGGSAPVVSFPGTELQAPDKIPEPGDGPDPAEAFDVLSEDEVDLLDWDELARIMAEVDRCEEDPGEGLEDQDAKEDTRLRRYLTVYFQRHPEHLRDFEAQFEEVRWLFSDDYEDSQEWDPALNTVHYAHTVEGKDVQDYWDVLGNDEEEDGDDEGGNDSFPPVLDLDQYRNRNQNHSEKCEDNPDKP